MNSDFFVLNLQHVPSSREEWVSAEVFEYGALGVSESLSFTQPEGEEDVFTEIPTSRSLDVYFQNPPSPELLRILQIGVPELQWGLRGEVTRDWLEEWKKGFKPFCLTGDHWVVPSWCEAPQDAKHKIWVDPGMAFGTGTHETTQLVAEEMSRRIYETPPESLLDVGTGTGILAILARQLNVKKVEATEIEADSRRVARENFATNSFQDIRLSDQQIEDLDSMFDMVVANIIDGVLVRVQDALKARVRPGGWLIVSGIITEREQDFLSGFQLPTGVQWHSRLQKGDWLAFSVRL